MSITKKTTKFAKVLGFYADCQEELVGCGGDLQLAHKVGEGYVVVETTAGFARWVNTFSSACPGDRVVLRKGGDRKWRMTGFA